MRKLTIEIFIIKARKKHGNKYDYSKVIYINGFTKIIIICPIHGEFEQRPDDHLSGAGCPKCKGDKLSTNRRSNKDEWVRKAFKVHGCKNDYSKFIYKGSQIKGCVTCLVNETHGDYWITPNDHLRQRGCPACKKDKLSKLNRFTKEDIIKKSIEIHGDKYGYDKLVRLTDSNNIELYCKKCKKYFIQNLINHLQGNGCKKCGYDKNADNNRLTKSEVIKRFIEVHDDLYGYNNVDYKGIDTCVIIDCKINDHGEFEQTPYLHLIGHGCPKCKSSKGELALIKIFKKHSINFKHQFKFDKYKKLRYDFYLKDLNLLVEFHGGQHYKPIKWFGGIEGFKSSIKRDAFKKSLAREYRIPIIYFTYKHFRMSNENFEKFVLSIINKVLQRKIIL